jgi:choline dehydrogenase-like flavoprotein
LFSKIRSLSEGKDSGVLIDARTLAENTTVTTDICIVGAGAAGITLAREFSGKSFRVCLLESGGLEFENETQSLYAGEIVGLPYIPLEIARLRYFGGTTNHWGGFCQPLDESDFESREWIPHSGWPFSKSHLDPFYERAQSILELGPFRYEAEAWETESDRRLPFMGQGVITKMVQFSSPTRFGRVYRNEIAQAENIRTYLHANVIEIEATKDVQAVTRLRVACLQGNRFWVSGKLFILAAGGIENARLLLLSNKLQRGGLGNQNDLVGRFFMDHIGLRSGITLLSDPQIKTNLYQYPWRRRKSQGTLEPEKKRSPAGRSWQISVLYWRRHRGGRFYEPTISWAR